jgi:hypothetical protein
MDLQKTIIMKQNFLVFLLIFIASCTTARLSVPPSFSEQATRLPVKGINGWQVQQKLSFGNYNTSKIKRGWDFSSSVSYTKFRISPEEAVLKVFDINTEKNTNNQKNKFQYTIEDGNLMAEVYATEKFKEKQLVYKSNNPWIGNASKTNKYEYAFTAAIVPLTLADKATWSLVLINKYDIEKDTVRTIFDKHYVEEEGYATNGKENIAIRPIRTERVAGKNGSEIKVLGGKMLSGYELQWNEEPAAMIDILENSIWMSNNIEADKKMIIASIASAVLLKRMQDVEKDKEHFDK